jgi:hypothetical protein
MDITTIALVAAGAGLLVAPRLMSLVPRASQQAATDILADLKVVAAIGRRMQAEGNAEAVRAANALIESVLRVPSDASTNEVAS